MQHVASSCWKLHLLLLAAVLQSRLINAARPPKVFDHVPQASPVFIVRDALVAQCQDFRWEAAELCSGAVPYSRLGMKSALCQKHYWCTPDGGACVTTCPPGQVFDSSCQCCRAFDAVNIIVFFNDHHRTCNWMPRDLPPKPAEALAPVSPTPAATTAASPDPGSWTHTGTAGVRRMGGDQQWQRAAEPPVPTLLVMVGATPPNAAGVPQTQSPGGARTPLAVYEPPNSSYRAQRSRPSASAQALAKAILPEQWRRARAARRTEAAAAAGGGGGPGRLEQQKQQQQR